VGGQSSEKPIKANQARKLDKSWALACQEDALAPNVNKGRDQEA
jgi:hypothetical protein